MMDAELGCTTTSIFIKISQKALSEALKISLALLVLNILYLQDIIIMDMWYSFEFLAIHNCNICSLLFSKLFS